VTGIDWSAFDEYPKSTCTCVCDCVYRSHAKYVTDQGLVSRKPCPSCGSTTPRIARSDPELFTIGR
jgi:hypothetical protein